LFATKQEIPMPYSLEDNAINVLTDSYGIKINDVAEGPIDVLKDTNVTYSISVVLTRELVRVDSDVSILHTNVKQIYEDALTVRKRFLNADQVGVPTSVAKIDYTSTTGIQFLKAKKFNYISVEIFFPVDISETI